MQEMERGRQAEQRKRELPRPAAGAREAARGVDESEAERTAERAGQWTDARGCERGDQRVPVRGQDRVEHAEQPGGRDEAGEQKRRARPQRRAATPEQGAAEAGEHRRNPGRAQLGRQRERLVCGDLPHDQQRHPVDEIHPARRERGAEHRSAHALGAREPGERTEQHARGHPYRREEEERCGRALRELVERQGLADQRARQAHVRVQHVQPARRGDEHRGPERHREQRACDGEDAMHRGALPPRGARPTPDRATAPSCARRRRRSSGAGSAPGAAAGRTRSSGGGSDRGRPSRTRRTCAPRAASSPRLEACRADCCGRADAGGRRRSTAGRPPSRSRTSSRARGTRRGGAARC